MIGKRNNFGNRSIIRYLITLTLPQINRKNLFNQKRFEDFSTINK